MFTTMSMTLSYPYGTTQTISEPPAAMFFSPTATSMTVTLDNGFQFAAEPLNWVAVQGAQFKQIKDLTNTDLLLTLMPTVSYMYTPFGSVTPGSVTTQQRKAYRQVVSTTLSTLNSGLPVNLIIPIQTTTPANRCYCLTSTTDCSEGGILIATPIVTIV